MYHLNIRRTSTGDPDFIHLISLLDNELWVELHEDQSTYEQYNKVPGISTAIVVYDKEKPIACGCYKEYSTSTIEIKRMFVEKAYRGNGIAKLVLHELENRAIENGFQYAILETSIHFAVAKNLYQQGGYIVTPNYDQYKNLEESVCMKKNLM
ncbi:MAG TPA: GNAT family N-acetyltransferase [Parafilimonas sp.]|nr:GNAT family N-acetyltransferase [Parafilimonas sp.]